MGFEFEHPPRKPGRTSDHRTASLQTIDALSQGTKVLQAPDYLHFAFRWQAVIEAGHEPKVVDLPANAKRDHHFPFVALTERPGAASAAA